MFSHLEGIPGEQGNTLIFNSNIFHRTLLVYSDASLRSDKTLFPKYRLFQNIHIRLFLSKLSDLFYTSVLKHIHV